VSIGVLRRKHKINELEEYFQLREPECIVYYVKNPTFRNHLLSIEQKHPQSISNMKIAIIYCKAGQKSAQEWFQNNSGSDQFWKFVNLMGSKIDDISTHTGYKGDVGKGIAFYDRWKGLEIIYHVAPRMNTEMIRRLIGNDIATIFFLENGSFDPTPIDELGTVPQIFIVVQPFQKKYRLAYINKTNIRDYGSSFPDGVLFSGLELKDRILTKFYDGYVMTKQCPPMQRLFYIPRGSALEDLGKKFPYESKKDRKNREKAELRKRQVLQKNVNLMEYNIM